MTGLAVVGERTTLTRDEAYFDREQLDLIKSQIAKGCTDAEVAMFVGVCKRLKLDPFARQIYCIKRRENRDGQWIEVASTQVSIDGFRVVAERTREYEGQCGPQWCGPDGKWVDVWLSREFPLASRVGVWRHGWREPLWGIATWASFAQTTKDGSPTKMWRQMPDVMLAKCAESQALRKAFPNDLSGIYTPEEMGNEGAPIPGSTGSADVRDLGRALHDDPEPTGAHAADADLLRTLDLAMQRLTECVTADDVHAWVNTWAPTVSREPASTAKNARWKEVQRLAAGCTPPVRTEELKRAFGAALAAKAPKPAAAPDVVEGITEDGEVTPGARAMEELQSVETREAALAWVEDNRAWLAGIEVNSSEDRIVWKAIRARCGDETTALMEQAIS